MGHSGMATSGQVIIHLDLDCFYCQVEQKRLGIPREVPAAVQQWDGLIAINYAARALGVTRHMRVMQAMHFCPELKCIHVQTLGGEQEGESVDGPVNSGLTHPNDRLLQKACLERYRRASAEIIALIRSMIPKAPLEKASIDEVFVDVTGLVEKELEEREDHATSEHAQMDAFAWGSVVEGGPLQPENEYDRRLSAGANIACRLRGAIRDKLDFTSSAGIAHTKMVAKVGSARNKPDQQTIIAARGITGLMEDLPLKKLRNFGGKLGEELRALGATTAGQVAAIPLKQLQHHFGDRAKWILDCVTGQYSEPVSVRDLSKSMLAAKSFVATSDMSALERWLGILADELSDRMIYDAQINQRIPRLLVLSYRQQGSSAGRSRSISMPKAPAPGPTSLMLQEAAMSMLTKCADAIPCNNLGLTATEFQDAPGDELGCITRFFQAGSKGTNSKEQKLAKEGSEPDLKVKKEKNSPTHQHRLKLKPPTIDRLFKKANTHTEPSSHSNESRLAESKSILSNQTANQNQEDSSHSAKHSNHCPTNSKLQDDKMTMRPDDTETASLNEKSGEGWAFKQSSASVSHHTEAREKASESRQFPWSLQAISVESGKSGWQSHSNSAVEDRKQTKTSSNSESAKEQTTHDNLDFREAHKDNAHTPSPGRDSGQPSKIPSEADLKAEHSLEDNVHVNRTEDQPGSDHTRHTESEDLGPSLAGVDLDEQKKIMREIWMQQQLGNGNLIAKKRQLAVTQSKGPKQPRLTDLFRRS